MKTIRTKTIWINADGTEHDTPDAAQEYERYATIRKLIEAADLDWRDGVGEDAATPDRIARLLAPHLSLPEQEEPELLNALKGMCAEFRELDLSYGSKAYAAATHAINKALSKATKGTS
jgi:hypothetical protein